jgi:sec-independent protein translocase protein TatA
MFGLGFLEIAVLVVLGVLLFGKNLPSVGRYVGKSIVEFKKGVKGLEDDFEGAGGSRGEITEAPPHRAPQRVGVTAPKFEDVAAPSTNVTTAPPPRV